MISEMLKFLKEEYPTLSDTNARLLVGQSRYETGNFTSRFFKEGNNLFGILFVGQPQASGFILRTSDKYRFAKYDNWKNSIRDRMRLYRIKYPHIVGSDDVNKILDTWLFDYLGRNASSKLICQYKSGVISLTPKISSGNPDEKKNPKSGSTIVLAVIISILWISLN